MTHINEDIQADSLKFLELCLDLFPELFLKHCDKVLHNFLDLISHKQISVPGKKHDSKGIAQMVNRELSVKPSGKMSAAKTRNDILQKLLKIVSVVFRTDFEEGKGLDQVKDIELEKSLNNYVLLKYGLFDTDKRINLFSGTEYGIFTEATDATNKTRLLIQSFMPILFNCWNDANPSSYSMTSPGKTDQLSLSMMVAIVSIIRKISSYEKQGKYTESFAELYFKDFVKDVISFFPFSMVNATQGKTKKKGMECDADLVQMNIDICVIYCKSVAHYPELMKQTMKYMRMILLYIVSLVTDVSGKDLIDHLDCIKEILNVLLKSPICFETESQGNEGRQFEFVLKGKSSTSIWHCLQFTVELKDCGNTVLAIRSSQH